jgi:hypothetical protein
MDAGVHFWLPLVRYGYLIHGRNHRPAGRVRLRLDPRSRPGGGPGRAARSTCAAGGSAPDGDAQRVDEAERRIPQGEERGGELAGVDGAN